MNERAHALDFYDRMEIPRRKSEKIVDAFLDKGFVLRDIGGGDVVWHAAFMQHGNEPDKSHYSDLQIGVLGPTRHQPTGWQILTGLDETISVQVEGDSGGGFFFSSPSAQMFLDSWGTFNVTPRE